MTARYKTDADHEAALDQAVAPLLASGEKRCTRCQWLKPLSAFTPERRGRLRLCTRCKACVNLAARDLRYVRRAEQGEVVRPRVGSSGKRLMTVYGMSAAEYRRMLDK